MRVGLFTDAFELAGKGFREQFERVGENTGNLIFLRAIRRLFSPKILSPSLARAECAERFADCDKFITTELIWIREGAEFEGVRELLRAIGDRPLIPISVGLQADERKPDFRFSESALRLLSEMSERCVLGTRGFYTAEILTQNGIKNVMPVGCPSVFYKKRYRFPRTAPSEPRAVCGFSTLWRSLREEEAVLLRYFMEHSLYLVEQTGLYSFEEHGEFDSWMAARRRMFFSTKEWDGFLDGFDFYMGMRFHGGIAAMQRGLPALFVCSDSRTEELCEFFDLPRLALSEFDPRASLSYYMSRAYPEAFLRRFPTLKRNFLDFAERNRLKIYL